MEPKHLHFDYRDRIVPKTKVGAHFQRDVEVRGEGGSEFVIIARQSAINPIDFSIILAVVPQDSYVRFRLRRYNGKAHPHRNHLEGGPRFYDFHIHMATERYQLSGDDEDTFAEPTDRFGSFDRALECFVDDCGVILPTDMARAVRLFE